MTYLYLKQHLKRKKKKKYKAQHILINEFNDTTSVFHECKNDDPNTLFFRRTCESTCCWGNKHSMNGFLIKYNKDTKSWYYYCYGEECKNKIFKIGEENTYDDEDISSIIEQMENNDHFRSSS